MPNLREVAERAQVSLITAYQVLSNAEPVEEQTRRAVFEAASALDYRLNITIRDVADEAGVSIATVSYVLNNTATVSPTTRQRVLNAAASLNYRPNMTARNLQASKTRMIGYAWHDVLPGEVNAILDRFIYCMALAAESHGYHVLTFTQPSEDIARVYEELAGMNRVDGFILSNTNRDDLRIQRLMDLNVPFAAFGQANDDWDFPFVDVDGRHGIEMVTRHLLDVGHRRIAAIGWPEGSLNGDNRLQGYLDGLQSMGLNRRSEWIVRTQNTVHGGYDAVQSLVALPAPQRPTAIVCLSDMMAVGAMNYLESIGLQIGADIAITGYDDQPLSQYLRPPLTSLRQPIEAVTSQLVDLLIAEIEHRRIPDHRILLDPVLMIRASSSGKPD